jgi:hypothetical protein
MTTANPIDRLLPLFDAFLCGESAAKIRIIQELPALIS